MRGKATRTTDPARPQARPAATPHAASQLLAQGYGLHRSGQPLAALEIYHRVLGMAPGDPQALQLSGAALIQLGQMAGAIAVLRDAVARAPRLVDAWNNLGTAFRAERRYSEAYEAHRRASALEPRNPTILTNVGADLNDLGRYQEAIPFLKKAVAFAAKDPAPLNNLGNAYRALGQVAAARAAYERALALSPALAEAHNNLGALLLEMGDVEAALGSLDQAVAHRPQLVDAQVNRGTALLTIGDVAPARAALEAAIRLSGNAGAMVKRALACPVIARSVDEIHATRERTLNEIQELEVLKPRLIDPAREVGLTSFYYSYHGLPNRDLFTTISRAYRAMCPALNSVAPHCRSDHPRPRGHRIKVGFISKYLRDHAIGWTYIKMIQSLPREQFEVTAFLFAGAGDEMTQAFNARVEHVVEIPYALDPAREALAQAALDVLVYPDIGMEPVTYFLAFSRLAPFQFVLHGHPDTTGIDTIDYQLTSPYIEGPGATEQYSERLAMMPKPPHVYGRPSPSACITRADLGLPADRTLYACPQSLFKFHPEFDSILGEILRADPNGELVLFEGQRRHWTELLKSRFEATIPDVAGRIRWMKRRSVGEFIGALGVFDVMLDTIHFGGGNTSYQAFAMGTPIVTKAGVFARDRSTQSFYNLMDYTTLVAPDRRAYVDLALHLGKDRDYRAAIKAELAARTDILFDNDEGAKGFADFLTALHDGETPS